MKENTCLALFGRFQGGCLAYLVSKSCFEELNCLSLNYRTGISFLSKMPVQKRGRRTRAKGPNVRSLSRFHQHEAPSIATTPWTGC